jgi:hypothetical protein
MNKNSPLLEAELSIYYIMYLVACDGIGISCFPMGYPTLFICLNISKYDFNVLVNISC